VAWRSGAAIGVALCLGVASIASSADATPGRVAQALPVPVTGPDPDLARDLDAALALGPDDTCLTVVADGATAYDHRGSDLQIPASTQKLLTASAALAAIDPATTFRTELVAAGPVAGGVVDGDLVLVGGGDPVLTTDRYAAATARPAERPTTRLDELVEQLLAAGITEVRGQILVDDRRYDAQRTVATWPARYLAEQQSGALGALVVDDGFVLEPDDDGTDTRTRVDEPAISAGGTVQVLLASRGVAVAGLPAPGERPAEGAVLASVESPPLGDLVVDLLQRSDNHAAELLLKELGRTAEGEGSTAAGARAVAAWAAQTGAASPGTFVADGSGLDRTNQTTCQDLVAVLDAAEADGPIDRGLPVAGQTGTLAGRLTDTSAVGVLRAKTGSLNGVRSLAGTVERPEGGTATFALIANGDLTGAAQVEALVAELLATWEPPCPATPPAPILARPTVAPVAIGLATASGAGGWPAALVALAELQAPEVAPIDRCSREAGTPVDLGIG
jgi:D-alanyl-D-alanine carboxypeptidase/D-alanyl-D-alanine-endopeptidase (penicillin-binding protein 4)